MPTVRDNVLTMGDNELMLSEVAKGDMHGKEAREDCCS